MDITIEPRKRRIVLKIMFLGIIFLPNFIDLLLPEKYHLSGTIYETMNSTSVILLAVSFHSIIVTAGRLNGKLDSINGTLGGMAFAFIAVFRYTPKVEMEESIATLILFLFSIVYFSFTEFVRNMSTSKIAVNVKDNLKVDLSIFAEVFIKFIKKLPKKLLITAVITFMLYIIFRYDNTFVNHFGIFGGVVAVLQYFEKNESKAT